MKKWVCQVCGYIYEGDTAPEECPVWDVYKRQPIGWFVGLLIGYIRYKSEKWKFKSIVK